MYLISLNIIKMFYQINYFSLIILLYSLNLVSCNPSLNGLVTINDGNDQMQEESYLHFSRIPDEDDTRKILLQMGNQSSNSDPSELDLSATSNMAQILTNSNDNEQRQLQQQLQTNEDPLQRILPKVKFNCEGRKEGYYSDPDFNCEVFHYCKSNGFRFTLVCPPKSKYSMKAMTCVHEDSKLYECAGNNSSTASSMTTDLHQSTTTLQSLISETGLKLNEETSTSNSSSISNKNTIDQLIESNKMSTWNDILNRNNKYSNNPTQLNSNDILESFNQITSTLSSKLNDDSINLNNAISDINLANNSTPTIVTTTSQSTNHQLNDQQSIASQFGTRFNSNNNLGKNKVSTLKKVASPGYEDLATKYQKRKKFKTTTTISTVDNNAGGEIEATESIILTSQSNTNNNLTDKIYSTEQTATSTTDQYSTLSTKNSNNNINDQSTNNNLLNHHKDINEQSTSYQTPNDDSVQPSSIKLGQFNQNMSTISLTNTFNNQFNNQFDQSTDSGFKPIFMQTPTVHQNIKQQQHQPANQFKFVSSQLSFKDQIDTLDNLPMNNLNNIIHSASSTSNPILFLESANNTLINESNNNNSSNDLIKSSDSGYQSRENYKMMVKNVSDEKLKDFIKNNDLIDLSSTSISTQFQTPTNSPQIVPQFLKEKRSRLKMNENLSTTTTSSNKLSYSNNLNNRQNVSIPNKISFGNNLANNNWPQINTFQNSINKTPQSQYVNYWPYLNIQNTNKNYNSYSLDNLENIADNPEYKYDYVFGLSKVLPSFNSNFPPYLPDKNFINKYPFLFTDYFPTIEPQSTNNNNKIFAQKKLSPSSSNQQDKKSINEPITASPSNLPNWLKSKFSNFKSPINRNTNVNTNSPNGPFINTNNFLHSAASSSFNYPLYELPPPSLLNQKNLPLISPTQAAATANNAQQLNNLLNSQLINSQFLLNNAILPTSNTPIQNNQQQQSAVNNQNLRKTFFSQLSRLFSSASYSRPVRVPYPANLASAFSSLTQPFKGFLNATTSYIPIRKENPSQSSSNTNKNHNDDDERVLEEIEKNILDDANISPYTLNPQPNFNQQPIAQSTSLGQTVNQNAPLNFNAFQIPNNSPLQSIYGPIKRSSFNAFNNNFQSTPFKLNNQQQFLKNYFIQQQQQQQQVRSMMNNKPNDILQQTNNQFSTITFPKSSSLPFSIANRHDLMDFYVTDSVDLTDEMGLNKRKRRKRSIAYNVPAPLHAIHYHQPKYTFPFLPPYLNSQTPSLPALVHSLPPAPIGAMPAYFPYVTPPVLPPFMPTTQFSKKQTTVNNKISPSESQIKPQIASINSSISPASNQSSSGSNSTLSLNTKLSLSTLPNISSLSSLSLASAANQIAISLASISNNISKNHKHTKIAKHLSKLASSSSNFLPTISNLTNFNVGLENLSTNNNKTLPRETATVWQRPPGKSTFTTWSFSAIPSKELMNTFSDFPFFNQYNMLRNIPATTYFTDTSRTALPVNSLNGQYNPLELNSFSYHTLPNPGSQIPKLHVEYRPALQAMNNFNTNNQLSTSSKTGSTSTLTENDKKSNDDELYGKRKIAALTAAGFRDLLNAYKQPATNTNDNNDNNNLKEGQISHHQFSPDYGFPKTAAAIIFKSKSAINKESNNNPKDVSLNQYFVQTDFYNKPSSKYQSQSSNNRFVKQQLSSATGSSNSKTYSSPGYKTQYELTDSKLKEDYKDFYTEYDLQQPPTNEIRKFKLVENTSTGKNLDNHRVEEDDENDYNLNHQNNIITNNLNIKNKKNNHLQGRGFKIDDYSSENYHQSSNIKSNNNHKQKNRPTSNFSYKSMNRNLKSYNNNKKSDYQLDNYHETTNDREQEGETEEDEMFFKNLPNRRDQEDSNRSKVSSRQLSSKKTNRDLKNSDDFDDDFFNQDDNEDISKKFNQMNIKHHNPVKLNSKQSTRSSFSGRPVHSKTFFINNKSSKKSFPTKEEESFDDEENGNNNLEKTGKTIYNNDQIYDTHQQSNDNYLNKNQLNFQTPRSILVKTSSFSYEIPNHSVHEEVELDDHIGKQHKIRPTYTLDQTARKTTSFPSISTGLIYHTTNNNNRNSIDQPLQQPDYDTNIVPKFSGNPNDLGINSRSNGDYNMPFRKSEKQHFATTIEHKKGKAISSSNDNFKSNIDDSLFNQFEIKRQPNLITNSNNHNNHHLPHSHREDVEAYYKAVDKKPSKGKFRQFFHQQELKHTGQNNGKNNIAIIKSKDLLTDNLDDNKFQLEKLPVPEIKENIKNTHEYNESKEKENKSINNDKVNSSPKPPRMFFNWHSSISHNKNNKQQPLLASRSKIQKVDLDNNAGNENDFGIYKDDENEPINNSDNETSDLNKPKLNHHNDLKNNLKNTKNNIQPPAHNFQQKSPHYQPKQQSFSQQQNQNYKPIKQLDDDWFKEQDIIKLPDIDPPENTKSNNKNSLDNDIDDFNPGDIEYENELPAKTTPPSNNNNNNNDQNHSKPLQLNDNNKQKPLSLNNQPFNNPQNHHHAPKKEFNRFNTKPPIKLQVMDQQNKQYKPITSSPPPSSSIPNNNNDYNNNENKSEKQQQTDQPSSKNSISPQYKTKYLKSSEFLEKQKLSKNTFKNSLKQNLQPAINNTMITNTPSNNKDISKNFDYQKAKLINLKYKKDDDKQQKENKKSENLKPQLPFTRTTTINKSNQDKNSASVASDKSTDKNDKPKNELGGKKIILNNNLQNSSTTINAQVLEKLPISVDSIFDNIDDDNFNDYDADQQKNSANKRGGDLLTNNEKFNENNNLNDNQSNENHSNENSLNDDNSQTNTSNEQKEFGARIHGGGRGLQPKISIKASYSSITSTIPRAMAQKMDKQKVDTVGFRSLEVDDLNLKKDNSLFKNHIKQFKKANWLSPLTTKFTNNLSTTTPATVQTTTIKSNNNSLIVEKEKLTWKGFTSLQSRQQKLIEQKKKDDKLSSVIRKPISNYLSKFKKDNKKDNIELNKDQKENLILTTTTIKPTIKTTATTIPTTTVKTIVHYDKTTKLNDLNKKIFNKLDQNNSNITVTTSSIGLINNKTDHHYVTSTTISTSSLFNNKLTNYNLNFNNSNNQNNNSSTTTTDKPFRRIFSAFSAGTLQEQRNKKN